MRTCGKGGFGSLLVTRLHDSPSGRHPDPLPLLIPQRRRVNRQIEQGDVVRRRVVQDGRVATDQLPPECPDLCHW